MVVMMHFVVKPMHDVTSSLAGYYLLACACTCKFHALQEQCDISHTRVNNRSVVTLAWGVSFVLRYVTDSVLDIASSYLIRSYFIKLTFGCVLSLSVWDRIRLHNPCLVHFSYPISWFVYWVLVHFELVKPTTYPRQLYNILIPVRSHRA